MDFQEKLEAHIALLENRPDYESDSAFKQVVALLKQIKTRAELNTQKSLINRLSSDSIADFETIGIIQDFIQKHTNL